MHEEGGRRKTGMTTAYVVIFADDGFKAPEAVFSVFGNVTIPQDLIWCGGRLEVQITAQNSWHSTARSGTQISQLPDHATDLRTPTMSSLTRKALVNNRVN